STQAVFYPQGAALASGAQLVQPDLAAALERIALLGAPGFYDGETATRMIEAIRTGGGVMTLRDLREYKAVWRAPLKISFGQYSLYTVAPPSGGGMVLAEALNILSGYDLAGGAFQT